MQTEINPIACAGEILKEAQKVCDDFGLHSLKPTIKSINNFAEQNHYLDYAVLGQFKVGKSSFLNSFIGQPLLPVGNIPVTSVITRLRFGTEEKATVIFLNGSSQEISVSEIESYVSESGNPENRKEVHLVDIESRVMADIKEIRLVDTPGIGSIWRHNTETTTGWFPETGGVLFLISAERPISDSELSLLKDVYRYTPQIAIIITKTDLYTDEKLREIEAFTSGAIRKSLDCDFPIFRYSAFANTDIFNAIIKERVLLPAALNRDEIFARVLQHKIAALVDSCLSYLDIAYQASLRLESEKSKLKKVILGEHLNSHFIRHELLLIIKSYKEKNRESIGEYLAAFRQEVEEKLYQDYENAFPTWKGNLYQVTRQFEDWLKESLGKQLKEIILQEEKTFELLDALQKHLSFYLKSFRQRLNTNLEQVLGVQMKMEDWDIGLKEMKKPDISISRTFDFHLDMLWFLFPMSIFRGVFRRYFRKQIPYEVEKNLHRLTSSLNVRVNKEMDQMMEQALAYMNEELHVMERLLAENQGDSKYISERMDKIKSMLPER